MTRTRRVASSLVFSATVALAVLVGGCKPKPQGPPPPGATHPAASIPLLDPGTVPGAYMLRQRIEGAYGDRKIAFEAVVQKQDNTLLVLTLTPYGSRAFAITQTGDEVTVDKFISRDLPFDPRFILLDVQRVFMMGLPDAPLADGWHRGRARGELIRERWSDGKLHERRFRRRDRNAPGEIVIRYEGGYVPGQRPPNIALDNQAFGYTLDLQTSDYQPL